jgi:hypothetical protein
MLEDGYAVAASTQFELERVTNHTAHVADSFFHLPHAACPTCCAAGASQFIWDVVPLGAFGNNPAGAHPQGLTTDAAGNLIWAEFDSNCVRRWNASWPASAAAAQGMTVLAGICGENPGNSKSAYGASCREVRALIPQVTSCTQHWPATGNSPPPAVHVWWLQAGWTNLQMLSWTQVETCTLLT